MKNRIMDLKLFNWKLFIALCALSLMPAVYSTIRTFLISANISTSAFDIIGQMEWFDLINETICAFLIVPLYSILNKLFNKKLNFSINVFKMGFIVFSLYLLFSLLVYFYAMNIVSFMNPNEIDIAQTTRYVQLETIAFIIGIIPAYLNVVFLVIGKSKNFYIILVLKAGLLVVGDFLLIPNFGVDGVAFSNILINLILTITCIIILYRGNMLTFSFRKQTDKKIYFEWIKIGLFSGTQSFIDNIFYALMICKMVNVVSEQGNYWIANNFIWTWLLIPILAIGEIIKKDCSEKYVKLKQSNYYLIYAIIVALWIFTIPAWSIFFKDIQKLSNYQEIFDITIKLFPFYIVFGLTLIPDSLFIGKGKTNYSAINSLLVNLVYYGIFFILYKVNLIQMNMNMIIIMFGCGMIFHWIISIIQEKVFLKKKMNFEI